MTAFALQPLVIVVLVAGFLHASRIPAGLRASSIVALSSSATKGVWVGGVKKAGFMLVVLAPIAGLFPLHWVVLGPPVAAVHALVVGLAGLCLLEIPFLEDGPVPFVSRYDPPEHALAVAPIYLALTIAAVYLFAWIERLALAHGGAWVLVLTLTAVWLGLFLLSRRTARRPLNVDADDVPTGAVQPLNLLE